MIVAKQLKAARVMVNMSQKYLGMCSSLSAPTIQRMEASDGPVRGNAASVWKLRKALEEAGIEFIDATDDRGPGVRLRCPETPAKPTVSVPVKSPVPAA